MNTYYFTFGSDGHPYVGGWVEIIAEDIDQAQEAFATRYGYNRQGFLRYCSCYTADRFMQTSMCKNGNIGAFCHEHIVAGGNT